MELTKSNFDFLKTSFLDLKNKYPFISSEIFRFLGFSRHSNFKRFINKKDLFNHLLFSDSYEFKINSRAREVIFLDRVLFYKIAIAKYPHIDELGKYYAEYKSEVYKQQILRFSTLEERNNIFSALRYKNNLYGKFKGEMYAFSLNTLNYALAIDYDPFLMYKFYCIESIVEGVSNQINCNYYREDRIPYPYSHFDHKDHYQRLKYLRFLNEAFENLDLSPLQIEFHNIYVALITELLEKQKKLDIKAGRLQVNERNDPELAKLMKTKYREAAIKCHPDKGGDEELFKKLNKANEKGDFNLVEKIHKQVLKK